MKLKKIKLEYSVIEDNFKLDKDLIENYHIEDGNDYRKCSKRTYEDLLKCHESFNFYGIFLNEELIAFFGTEFDHYVNTIFVKPQYRKKQYMSIIFNKIKETVGNKFYTALYEKNKRAINFYIKNGGQVIKKQDNIIILEVLCQ